MKKMAFLFLLITPFSIISMDQQVKTEPKIFPANSEALSELTDKSIGCSEDLTDRAVKYTHNKDIARQKKYKNKLGIFLEKMHQKYSENQPSWLNHIDPEGKPFPTENRDVCDFIPNGQYKMSPSFFAHCSNLNKSTAPLSHKDQALLNFVYNAADMESEWLEWRTRIITEGNRKGRRRAFEKIVDLHFETDENGINKKEFNKKEKMWEPIVTPIMVHEHLNSPHFKKINEKPNKFDSVNIFNAYENENYHKELMFMERQLLKMQLFNKIDREKLEQELDKTWNKKEKVLNSWSISSLFKQIFQPTAYALEQEQKRQLYEAHYNRQHENAQKNLDGAIAAKERLEQEIKLFKKPQNRLYITRSCMKKSDFENLQNARDLCFKE